MFGERTVHVILIAIGNAWETFHRDDVISEPGRYVETAPVAPGSVTIAEIDIPVPCPIARRSRTLVVITARIFTTGVERRRESGWHHPSGSSRR
jgi:nitrite reductase (NO-forming)